MNDSASGAATRRQALDFSALLIDTLAYAPDEFVSIGHDGNGGNFQTAVMSPADAAAYLAKIPDRANVYFGVNPVAGPARRNGGRGTANDVTRVAGLWADLDVKPGGCANLDVARAIVANLSIILGTRASATVESGHGLHAYWPIADGHITDGDITGVRALLKRWGRLVAVAAAELSVSVDNVFDLARMMRIPGTLNNKNTNGQGPLPVFALADTGGPLALAEIDERLNEYGIFEEPDDREGDTEELSDPGEWQFAPRTCAYVAKLIDNLSNDGPPENPKPGKGRGRHQWAASQAVRLTCALRLGCISETDWRTAQKLLKQRLQQLRAATDETVPKHEVSGLFKLGRKRAAAKTEERARAELGNHKHGAENMKDEDIDAATDSTRPADIHKGHARFAYLLAERETGKLLHVYGIGWFYWDGKRWLRDDKGKTRRAVLAINRQQWHNALRNKELASDCRRVDTATGINGVLEIASALEGFAVTVGDLDADPFQLNVANGTLDLHTLDLSSHSPADRITKICNGAYDPNAETPVWGKFLSTVLPDEQVRAFVQRLAGLSLIGEVREHVLAIFRGIGRNGKGTLYKALLHALGGHGSGSYGLMAEPDLFMVRDNAHPTGQMDLLGKRLVVVSENDRNRRLDEAKMKRLTGGDLITARYMRKDNVTFGPSHLPILVTNHLPRVSGDDPAVWARLRVVPFDVVIPDEKQDKTLEAKLQLEADGILTWMVDGLRDYLENGLAEPDSVRVATDNYQRRNDAIGRFIEERCDIGVMFSGTTTELYAAWHRWQESDGCEPMGRGTFGEALDSRGYAPGDPVNGKRLRRGIGLKRVDGFAADD